MSAYVQPHGLPPAELAVTVCQAPNCRAVYLDNAEGRSTHRLVFGHVPPTTDSPADEAHPDPEGAPRA